MRSDDADATEGHLWIVNGSADMKYRDGNGTVQTVGRSGGASGSGQSFVNYYQAGSYDSQNVSTTLTKYSPLLGVGLLGSWQPSTSSFSDSTESDAWIAARAGTLQEFHFRMALLSTAAGGVTVSVLKNGVSVGSVAFAIGDGDTDSPASVKVGVVKSSTGLSVAIAAGDKLKFKISTSEGGGSNISCKLMFSEVVIAWS